MREHEPEEHLVVYRTLSNETKDQLLEQVQAALELCRQPKHGQRPGLGVLFLFDPKATWTWLSMPPQDRQALEDRIDVMTFPRRWDILGVRQRLTQHNKMDSDEVCRQVLQATGGWPYLLDVLFYRCGLHEDPRPFAQAIEREFIEHSTKLVQQFCSCLGLAGHDIARRVLEFVHHKKEVPARLVTPDALGGTPPLTPAVCDAAVEYLWRMGCVEVQDSLLSVESVVGRMLTQS
jgi:hypothetical protein